ncbi:hypothetical protein TNCV_2218851 [Trichonephila clavipes]|nr:hypothetical protein TNCV_2218851 [Trichonephila clavipes]
MVEYGVANIESLRSTAVVALFLDESPRLCAISGWTCVCLETPRRKHVVCLHMISSDVMIRPAVDDTIGTTSRHWPGDIDNAKLPVVRHILTYLDAKLFDCCPGQYVFQISHQWKISCHGLHRN